MESREKNSSPVSVLSPPVFSLVLELLIDYPDYLDIFALQTLRLVCKTTKNRVETPEILRHFRVRINGKGGLDELLSAPDPVPWNSFVFCKIGYYSISSEDIQRFVAAFGDLVLHLELENIWRISQYGLSLLSGCPHLESLTLPGLLFRNISDDLAKRLLQNLKNLRHFDAHGFIVEDYDDRCVNKFVFFSEILSTCTKLKSLTVPCFRFDSSRRDLCNTKSFQRLVVTPLLDVIAQGCLRSITVPYNDLAHESFLSLAIRCQEMRIVLHSEFRIDEFLETLSSEHMFVLDTIANLNAVTDTIIRQPLTNVRTIWFREMGYKIKNNAYDMPPFHHLTDLTCDFTRFAHNGEGLKSLELFVHRLAQVRRPTVKRLNITYAPKPMTCLCLCTSFRNLKVLRVSSYSEGKDEEWLQLWPLVGRTLVELELLHCPNLTDRGILGDDLNQPAFLQLKHLRKLRYHRFYKHPEERISELSFIYAFCHMRLRYFDFFEGGTWDIYKRVSTQTVKAMWDGPFGETIEHFVAQRKDLYPRKNPQELGWMKRIRMAFMNIRRV